MQAAQNHLTREEYLAIDDASTEKHQFYQGEIFAMSGGSFNHARIATNLTSRIQVSGDLCQPMNSDMRVSTPTGLDTYPDISVYCDEPELTDRNYDQGEKFEHYRSIPCLQDYLLIDSERIYVAHHQRQGPHQWLLREYYQLTDKLTLTAAGLTVSLAEIYQGTKW